MLGLRPDKKLGKAIPVESTKDKKLFELLRNKLFTGFPWLISGYSLLKWPELIQSASVLGLFWLSVIALLPPIILFIFIDAATKSRMGKHHKIACLVFSLLLLINFSYT